MNEKKIIEIEERIMAQTFAKRNLTLVKGKGALVWDIEDNEYIDCTGSYGVAIVGHCHPKVIEAISEQSKKYMHLMVYGEYNQKPQVDYATLLCNYLPKSLNSVYFTTGGSESIEGAMKLAKRSTGRSKLVSFNTI